MINNLNENISFFLKEKELSNNENINDENGNEENDNDENIKKMMYELDEKYNNESIINNKNIDLIYFNNKEFYNNDELYYNQEYSVKDLLKICNYYGIDKNIRISKCKKQDIIYTIMYFESLPENYMIVQERNLMWAYMKEILNNTKMKKNIIWN